MGTDFRSDTVTRPTDAMRDAMMTAAVGDDVYGEDPTVNQLEAVTAEMLGKEAGLFMPSGTMANQVAILTHTERGDEVFIHRDNHAYYYEGGAAAMWGGVTWNLLEGIEGTPTPEILRKAIRPKNIHHPNPRLLCLENTHNRAGGAAIRLDRLVPLIDEARSYGLGVHLDGARLFNAAIAFGISGRDLAQPVDSVSICLSKGLGAPVGSVLLGSRPFIDRARIFRKWLGGGMRQAGIIAAAGLYALTNNVQRLEEDHGRARLMAHALSEMGYQVMLPAVPTNMVMLDFPVAVATHAVDHLAQNQVLVGTMGPQRVRLVTHLDIDDEGVTHALRVFRDLSEHIHA